MDNKLSLFIQNTGEQMKMLLKANSADPDEMPPEAAFHQGLLCLSRKRYSGTDIQHFKEFFNWQPLRFKVDYSILIVTECMG